MTIKEAFGNLYKAVKKSGLNPFFLIGNLKDEFKDIADNVVDGADVEVESAQSSGYLVGNIKVNGEDNYLFAPPQVPPLDIYSDTERLVGVWFHDGISEDIYQRTFTYNTAQNHGSVVFSTGLTDVGEIFSFEGVASYESSGVNNKWVPFVFSNDSLGTGTNNAILKINSFLKTTGEIYTYIGDDYQGDYAINRVRITLKYTKNN